MVRILARAHPSVLTSDLYLIWVDSHALGYLLNSGPDPPQLDNKQPEQCLDLGCGAGGTLFAPLGPE